MSFPSYLPKSHKSSFVTLLSWIHRLGYLTALILAVVGFQNTVQDSLPAVPYPTLMEQYILICTIMLFIAAVLCGFVKYGADLQLRELEEAGNICSSGEWKTVTEEGEEEKQIWVHRPCQPESIMASWRAIDRDLAGIHVGCIIG